MYIYIYIITYKNQSHICEEMINKLILKTYNKILCLLIIKNIFKKLETIPIIYICYILQYIYIEFLHNTYIYITYKYILIYNILFYLYLLY